MLKGINKQIIEIKCTEDEFFEKALLFVRADKTELPYDILSEKAMQCCAEYIPQKVKPKSSKPLIITLSLSLAALTAVLMYLIF